MNEQGLEIISGGSGYTGSRIPTVIQGRANRRFYSKTGQVPSPMMPFTNGWAITGLVCSILWLGGIGSILGLICGLGSRQTVRADYLQRGEGIANLSIVVSLIGLVASAVMISSLVHQG